MLVFANRPGSQATTTTEGNILQCVANVNTTGEFLPGQFPLSAIDGATSTRWQPVFDTDRVYMTVDLGVDTPYYPVTHGVTEISRPYDPARLPIVERSRLKPASGVGAMLL
ncbi:carbohydrate-binding module family 32 protein [Pleomassaria siparia CBS 279.74]|uniref:Carbohydrate-binding module family 32 protein n=1 Tax=Pleomassaria siparia CBS 279.74 TaxID=1314801 RepID=A0A6G1KGZ4_9PLEO|nr:carbohydrate-binding module family 32 protein [Pleomassaria siparia CBS 279.74]